MAREVTAIRRLDPAERRALQDLSRRIEEIAQALAALELRVEALEP